MKKQNFKKPLSVVLSGFMAISLGRVANLKINAEAASDPSINKFATADQLLDEKNFNLREVGETENVYGGKGTKAQKVYFGKDESGESQKWYIAGSEHDASHDYLVLFSDPAQPLLTNRSFGGNNKYSTSNLKKQIKALETDGTRFTTQEQAIMAKTTYSTKNDTGGTDKLYPANGTWLNSVMTVGSGDNINIHINAISGSSWFWLRAPNPYYSDYALVASPGTHVSIDSVDSDDQCVVSASKIDLMSLIFASSASAVVSHSSFSNENTMTFRYKDTEEKIQSNATISNDNSEITVTKSTEDTGGVYLYIQGKNGNQDWVYSTKITEDTTVNLNDIGHEDADLSQCKIWLETFDETDNMVYAKFVTEKSDERTITFGISKDSREFTEIQDKACDEDELKKPTTEMNNLSVQLEEFEATSEALTERTEEVEKARLEEEIVRLKRKINDQDSEIDKLKKEMANKDFEIDSLKRKLDESNYEIEKWQKTVDNDSVKIRELQDKIYNKDSEIARLEREIAKEDS